MNIYGSDQDLFFTKIGYDLINIDSLDQLDCFSYTKNFCNFVVKALSSAWCENNLFLGSTDGIIAKYVFIETGQILLPRYEGFCVISKKQQITKLEAVKHCNILICHCGGNVHLLSRTELKIIKSIEGVYKNISLYFFKIFHMENHNIINVVSTPNLKRYIYRFLFLDSKNILILHSDGYYKYDIILLKYSPIILETTAKSQIPYVCQIFFDSKNCQWPPYMDDIIIPSVEYKNNTIKSLIDNNDIVCMLFITEAYRTHIFIYFGNGSFHQIYLMKWNESPLAVGM
ncbi:hypothetical protein HZS_6673 [Henneguya salminicola]|nr:hypothetical protein HZS_6673 [Henneguya salminicola]